MKRVIMLQVEFERRASQLPTPWYPWRMWTLAQGLGIKGERCSTCSVSKPVEQIFFRADPWITLICESCLKKFKAEVEAIRVSSK